MSTGVEGGGGRRAPGRPSTLCPCAGPLSRALFPLDNFVPPHTSDGCRTQDGRLGSRVFVRRTLRGTLSRDSAHAVGSCLGTLGNADCGRWASASVPRAYVSRSRAMALSIAWRSGCSATCRRAVPRRPVRRTGVVGRVSPAGSRRPTAECRPPADQWAGHVFHTGSAGLRPRDGGLCSGVRGSCARHSAPEDGACSDSGRSGHDHSGLVHSTHSSPDWCLFVDLARQ